MPQMLSLYFTDSTSNVDGVDMPCSLIVFVHYLQPFWTQRNVGCLLYSHDEGDTFWEMRR